MQNRLYVIGRADLAPGLRAAQAGHAVAAFALRYPRRFRHWRNGYLIFLEVEDGETLARVHTAAKHRALRTAEWHEPDLDGELTAFALVPSRRTRNFCSTFPLMLYEYAACPAGPLPRQREGRPLDAAPRSGSSTARAPVSKTGDPGSAPGRFAHRVNSEVM
jgi:hypothetical protein